MKLKTICALFTFAAFATLATADPIETAVPLTLTGVNGQSVGSYFVSPYTVLLGTTSLTVYCDDVLDEVDISQSWPVNVFSGLDTTGAYYAAADYPVLFWLAGQDTPANYVVTQEAMWTETDPAYSGATIASNLLLATAEADAGSVNVALWDVLTPADGSSGSNAGQEFLVDQVPVNLVLSPEPTTTMLIVIGFLAVGIGLLKRKRIV